MFETGDEFVETFCTVVGHFGAHGVDVPDKWLDGTTCHASARQSVWIVDHIAMY
jgi:hypothetical protein